MASAASDRRPRFRKTVGIALIVLGGLWLLLWAGVWYGISAPTGAAGDLLLALDWRFFGLTALGVAVVAVGIWLAAGDRADSGRGTRAAQLPAAASATASVAATMGARRRPRLSVVSEPAWQPTGIE